MLTSKHYFVSFLLLLNTVTFVGCGFLFKDQSNDIPSKGVNADEDGFIPPKGGNTPTDAGNHELDNSEELNPSASDLVNSGGCGSVFIFTHNDDDTFTIEFDDGERDSAREAFEAGTETYTVTFDLGDTENIGHPVHAVLGTNVTHHYCNDAIDPENEFFEEHMWEGAGGTATLILTPEGEPTDDGGYPVHATLIFEDLLLGGSDEYPTFTIESLVVEAFVGF